MVEALDKLKELSFKWTADDCTIANENEVENVIGLLDELSDLCRVEGLGNAAIATKNGGLELVCLICSKIPGGCDRGLISALNTMASFLHGIIYFLSFSLISKLCLFHFLQVFWC